jgi:chromate transporter
MATAGKEGRWQAVATVFAAFLKLGLTSFGGPIAHLGYFREEFVVRRGWLTDEAYGDLVTLCQFLPGPASSQTGFAVGLVRGGLLGGVAAWAAFTLPSALLLVAVAFGASAVSGPWAEGLVHGLKLVAVAVVAQAIWGMARTLTPDRQRAAIAFVGVAIVAFVGGAAAQIAAIAIGALSGLWLCRDGGVVAGGHARVPVGRRAGTVALTLFGVLLVVLPVVAGAIDNSALQFFNNFYRSGALVFGGGHVVLPLLQAVVVPQWVSNAEFLSGYGLAQAVPGPLFTVAAYLGFIAAPAPGGTAGAVIALVAVFLPGLLLVYGVLPYWDALRRRAAAQAAMRGANAAVVGILGAALYDPVWTGAVAGPPDFALALGGFLLLVVWKMPPWVVVVTLAAAGAAMQVAW